jgi:hypothetical protein
MERHALLNVCLEKCATAYDGFAVWVNAGFARSRSEQIKKRTILVPRAGVEPARPFGQRILSPVMGPLPSLTKRYKPIFTRLAVVKVSLRPA